MRSVAWTCASGESAGRVGNVALRQERAGVTRNHFRCPNLGTEMTEVSVVKTAVW